MYSTFRHAAFSSWPDSGQFGQFIRDITFTSAERGKWLRGSNADARANKQAAGDELPSSGLREGRGRPSRPEDELEQKGVALTLTLHCGLEQGPSVSHPTRADLAPGTDRNRMEFRDNVTVKLRGRRD